MAFFILTNVALILGGGLLSAIYAFDRVGYSFLLLLLGVPIVGYFVHINWRSGWARLKKRSRRPLPAIFYGVALLSSIGGAIHPPSQYDALTYRIPRILHWWSESHIHRISTPNQRMNYSAPGHELVIAPLLIVTKSDRVLFLPNLWAYLLMPGAVFVTLRLLGAGGRSAWNWMWLFPVASCYAMQAGGVGNDAYAATLVLGSLMYGLKARQSERWSDIALSVLAASLATAVKTSNAPLLLPLAWVVLYSAGTLLKRPLRTAAMLVVAASVSFVPICIWNYAVTRDWGGDPANVDRLRLKDPAAGLIGNSMELIAKCIEPPVLPAAMLVQERITELIPSAVRDRLQRGFPRFNLNLNELAQEENAGFGLGITVAFLAVLVFGRRAGRRRDTRLLMGLYVCTGCALLAYFAALGSESTGRLLAPYYPLLALPFMLALDRRTSRQRWWRWLAPACALSAILPLLITPSRPIIPPGVILRFARLLRTPDYVLARGELVYDIYGKRSDMLAELRNKIPANAASIGVVMGRDDSELSLWRPYGARVVMDPDSNLAALHCSPAKWWVVSADAWNDRGYEELSRWSAKTHTAVRYEAELVTVISRGPKRWMVMERSD